MFGLNAISFAAPWVLVALLGLPVLWWLLRVTPPSPRREKFPALAFLLNLTTNEESAQHTPLWLLILRLLLCAFLIFGLAGPILNPQTRLSQEGPLVLFIDNGWSTAIDWPARRSQLIGLVEEAERSDRSVVVVATAPSTSKETGLSILSGVQARQQIDDLQPVPWLPARDKAVERLDDFLSGNLDGDIEILWLSDGLDHGKGQDTARALAALGQVHYMTVATERAAYVLGPPQISADKFVVTVRRGASDLPGAGNIVAIGHRGRTLNAEPFQFEAGERTTEVEVPLPLELRNEVQWLQVEGAKSAASTFLLDERWRRRAVGIVSNKTDIEKPLLSDVFYPERAIRPFAEVHKGSLRKLLKGKHSVLILSDMGNVPADELESLEAWLSEGGTLVRFAGPRLAAAENPIVPVPLRQGGRALGGALSWNEPQPLAPFDDTSPFYGLSIPEDVTVARQVLAEPSIELNSMTWARLHDGTPLVTAAPRGDGWLVLFHVTSNAEWSTLPISGLFVEMLQRIVEFSRAELSTDNTSLLAEGVTTLKPLKTLNAFGRLDNPRPDTKPIGNDEARDWTPSPDQPPGLYGSPTRSTAFNLASATLPIEPLTNLPGTIRRLDQSGQATISLGPWLITLALLLAFADAVAMLALGGKFSSLRRPVPTATKAAAAIIVSGLCFAVFLSASALAARSQEDQKALDATLETRLAYVMTSDREVDTLSRAGLSGLTDALRSRTAAEPGDPIGINLETDELAFFPLIYWPVTEAQPDLSSEAIAKLNRFMKTGGTIVFDTGDQHRRIPTYSGQTTNVPPNSQRLRELVRQLDIPPLTPIPEDHVLTKSFYLLQDFPGRWVGGQVWVEAGPAGEPAIEEVSEIGNDGVSAVIIGSNDWAAAWAADERGQPMAPLVPGGDRQRELALRFGINLVMYSLTGNYKADQVHVPALLERLGQ